MRVLVTGNLGFVGNVLVKRLLQENFEVLGLDVGFYPQGFLESEDSNIYQIKKDLRKDLMGSRESKSLAIRFRRLGESF